MNTKNLIEKYLIVTLLSSLFFISACDGGDSGKKEQIKEGEDKIIEIDASDANNFVYYNLETLKKVSVDDPKNSSDWHIGFKRSSIILNGGDAGVGSVAGAVLAKNLDFYDGEDPIVSTFLNADPENQIEQFNSAKAGQEITEYKEDTNALAISGNSVGGTLWYNYNPGTHQITANTENYWIIRSGAGNSYAQFRVTNIAMNIGGRAMDTVDIELAIQGSGQSEFPEVPSTATLDFTEDDTACYDIDADDIADCEGTDWDISISSGFDIYLNSGLKGGGSGAALGLLSSDDLVEFSSGVSVPYWIADEASSIFSEESWYAYNLEGAHKLWSNYNVYAIDTDISNENSKKIKAQILSYYSAEGASGHYSIRVDDL